MIMKETVTIDARWIKGFFILPLGLFGILHFVEPYLFVKLVPAFAPYPSFWVFFSGVALTSSSLAIFTGILSRLANFLLILFVLTFIFTVDIPNIIHPHYWARDYFLISILKDTSLLGGSILYLVIDLKNDKK